MKSVEEWLKLPEIFPPTLRNESEIGSIFFVVKVGFLALSEKECRRLKLPAAQEYMGKCILPTAVIAANGASELRRIPLELGQWAFDSVALAQSGRSLFPSKVEFGILNGRAYAEHIQ
jgi:hypothetical protein